MISSKDRNLIHWDNNQMNIQQAYEKLDQTDLSAVVVCTGPGRYAGIRSGMAFALGLCAGFNLKLHTVSAFEIIAFKAAQKQDYQIILDARKNQVYQCEVIGNKLTTMQILEHDAIGSLPIVSNFPYDGSDLIQFDASDILDWYNRTQPSVDPHPEAIYLRPPTD
jgi:tRNA threonylcarbamoyl adenosine modification protein YeaZ